MRRLCLLFLVTLIGLPALRADTVVVLPFFNYSKSPDLDWIGESISETIRESLASEGVLVLDREDRLEAYHRLSLRPNAELTLASIIKVGEALDAAQVIYGNFNVSPPPETAQKSPSADVAHRTLRITAQIVNLKQIREGPTFGETGVLADLAALENHVGWQALKFLAPKTAPTEEEFRNARPPVRVDAIELYIRGLLAENSEQKHRLFAQAARLDEHFSQPCYQLGKMYWDKKDYRVAASWLIRVLPADSHYRESQFLLGLCRYYMGDFAGAQKCFELVAASVPLNEVFNDLGAAEARQKDYVQAIENYRKAMTGDDTDPDYHFNIGYALWKSGQYAKAIEFFRATLERNPNDSEAAALLKRCQDSDGPRPGDPASEGRERIKIAYEETAYRQLKAELESKK